MKALYRLSGNDRSAAVADAFHVALDANPDGRAEVKYLKYGQNAATVECFLVGVGWNPTLSGTLEALIIRAPKARYALDFIPYTRLVSIEPVKS